MRTAAARSGLLLITLMGCASEPAVAASPVIYGEDDRLQVHEVSDATLREAVIRAVPAMVRRESVSLDPETGVVTLASRPFRERYDLCPDEAFLDDPSAASCSATLIDDDLVLTAAHCVDSIPCAEQRYVFGWYFDAEGSMPVIDPSMVFDCAAVVAYDHTWRDDIAIVRLDRAAEGPPIEVRREVARFEERASMAGYPFGLPMKVVTTGRVTGLVSDDRFFANLDSSPGSSGSGVLDADLRLFGVLTHAPTQPLTPDGDCERVTVLDESEDITQRINGVRPALEALCLSGEGGARLCADFDAGPPRDAGHDADLDAGPPPDFAARCVCRAGAAPAPKGLLALALLVGLARRRLQGPRSARRRGAIWSGLPGPWIEPSICRPVPRPSSPGTAKSGIIRDA